MRACADFGRALPLIRARVARAISAGRSTHQGSRWSPPSSACSISAACAIGNESYAKDEQQFRRDHAPQPTMPRSSADRR